MYYQYTALPKEKIGIARPTISFYYSTNMTAAIASYAMYLNGQKVPAYFDKSRSSYVYTPDSSLAPGVHQVRMVISYSGYVPLEQSWSFTVADDALKQFPAVSADQSAGLAAINDYRTAFGLTPVSIDDRLNASATAHAQYLLENNVSETDDSLHEEQAGKPGFVGAKLGDRVAYFGYTDAAGEDAAYFHGTLQETIDALFDAPYHRSPFLNPDVQQLGIGRAGEYLVIDFGLEPTSAPQLIVSPTEGDRNAPTVFKGNETPDPLRMHTSSAYPVGYPIMAEYFGIGVDSVKLLAADIRDADGKTSVPFAVNTPENDDSLSSAVILLPLKPLQADTTYHVMMQLQLTKADGSKQTDVKEWEFTTEPAASLGKTKLHQNAADYRQRYVTASPLPRIASFGLDDRDYWVEGIRFPMTRTPLIVDGSSYLYIRDLAAALGADVTWDAERQAAVYTKGALQVTLFTASDEYAVNGQSRSTDTPAKLIEGYTMVPVRLLAEVLGADVAYLESARTVKITY
jgi:uncharacterized protein YkwD